jgi:hypothetical protein
MAARSVESGGLLVSDWMPGTVLGYTQIVEGLMPAAQVTVVDPLEGQWPGPINNALAAGRAAYLARPLMAASERNALTSAGPLVRVLGAPDNTIPPMSHPAGPPEFAGLDLEGEIRLLGCDVAATMPGAEGDVYMPSKRRAAGEPADTGHLEDALHPIVEGGSTLHVTVYWQALRFPSADYGVTLSWVDESGHTWLERQTRHPVGGTHPTSRWLEGQVVADYYRMALPASLNSGAYSLLATIGAPLAESGLQDADGSDQLELATFHVRKPQRWPASEMDVIVRELFGGGLVLAGYEAQPTASSPYEIVPGETVSVALQWLICETCLIRGEKSWSGSHPRLYLRSQDGAERPVTPLPRSPEDWQPGALVVETYPFVVPDDLAYVEVREPDSHGARYRLRLRIASEPTQGANFGNQVRLRGHTYTTTSVRPGDTVRLTLNWQAARTMDEAYKVFVHVLGADGLPIAQQDNEPVNGTYPTTRWQRGERVSDPYAITLPADLAPGEYAVEVGMYRISDLTRLPVLDKDQGVVDDKVYLAPLTVK